MALIGGIMRKHNKLDQPDMFKDPELIKATPGADAGMQLDMFGGTHLHATSATEVTQEAVEIIHRHNGIKEVAQPK